MHKPITPVPKNTHKVCCVSRKAMDRTLKVTSQLSLRQDYPKVGFHLTSRPRVRGASQVILSFSVLDSSHKRRVPLTQSSRISSKTVIRQAQQKSSGHSGLAFRGAGYATVR
jgi:hypothetical protein